MARPSVVRVGGFGKEIAKEVELLARLRGFPDVLALATKAQGEQWGTAWVTRNRLTPAKREFCAYALGQGKPCRERVGRYLPRVRCRCRGLNDIPMLDHPEFWVDEAGMPAAITFHPYEENFNYHLRELLAFCDRHGLECEISPLSWYYLGAAFRMILTRKSAKEGTTAS